MATTKKVKTDVKSIWRVLDANTNRAREGLRVVASDVGRDVARSIFYYTDSGRVLMKSGSTLARKRALEAEKIYTTLYGPYGPKSDATLF